MTVRFTLYGDTWRNMSYHELLALAEDTGMLHARAEDSGCEGVYVEVARWNDKARQWQRFAFEKFFDGDVEGETAWQRAEWIAAKVNHASKVHHVTWIHTLPNYAA